MKRLLMTVAAVTLLAPGAALACDKHESHSVEASPPAMEGQQSVPATRMAQAPTDAGAILTAARDDATASKADKKAVN